MILDFNVDSGAWTQKQHANSVRRQHILLTLKPASFNSSSTHPTRPPALFNTISCPSHTNNFDFASDAWAQIMLGSSSGCGKRSSSFFSPEKPPMYPHKRTPAPQTPSASARTPAAAARTPWRHPSFAPLAPASADSPRTRARSMMAISPVPLPSASSETPPIYKSPLAAASSAAGTKVHSLPLIKTPSAHVDLVSKSPAAAAAAAVISLRRSPRLATPTSSNQPLHAHARAVPAKTLGCADDARRSRIINMVVSAWCVFAFVFVLVFE